MAFWAALFAGALGATEPPAKPAPEASQARPAEGFTWAWTLLLPPRGLEGGDWHSWVASDQRTPRKGGRRGMPGTTVEVVDRFLDDHQERVLELNASWAPILVRSFQMGWQSSCTAQMLGEFMTMTAADLRPPSVPSVWYNGLIPYWVQQGWKSPLGNVLVVGETQNRPMMLYPRSR